MPVPILETSRLILRPFRLEDAKAYDAYFNDWEIVRYLGKGVPWPYSVNIAQSYIENMGEDELIWAITKKDRGGLSDELIGAIELFPENEESNRGFWLGREFHNQGLMTEAAITVTNFWFDGLDKKVMRFRNAIHNIASSRVKEKNGARLIRHVQKNYMDPEFTQAEVWEITAEEWREFRKPSL